MRVCACWFQTADVYTPTYAHTTLDTHCVHRARNSSIEARRSAMPFHEIDYINLRKALPDTSG